MQRDLPSPRLRGAWAVVLVAMLNLVAQPCAMATEMEPGHPCPHCPTEAMAGERHGHAGSGHAPAESGQVAEVADCDFVDIYSHDSRPAQPGFKDSPDDQPACALDSRSADARARVARGGEPAAHAVPDYRRPPLNVLHCVYLK